MTVWNRRFTPLGYSMGMATPTSRTASAIGLVLLTLADLAVGFLFYCMQAVEGAAAAGRFDGVRNSSLVLAVGCALTPLLGWGFRTSRPKLAFCLAGWPVAAACFLIGLGVLLMTTLKR